VTIKPGARIGQRGFGFFMEQEALHLSQLQLGRVVIGNHVEIGANTTIDRGSLQDTVVEDGVRIDNLVQLGHNVHVGKHSVLVAQVGIAGSTSIGAQSILAGQVGVAGHLTLGKNVVVAAKSGVSQNLAPHAVVGGIPAVPIQDWRRQSVVLKKLAQKGPKVSEKEEKKDGSDGSKDEN
jgi:UDP-3-O-[3-hydroxymyristoyl] glucosamine N-acyltransferase